MSDAEYSEEEAGVQQAMSPRKRNVAAAASSSGGGGMVVGVGIAAAVAVAGAVGVKLLLGKSKSGRSSSSVSATKSSSRKRVTPSKKPTQRSAEAESGQPTPAAAAAGSAGAAVGAAVAAGAAAVASASPAVASPAGKRSAIPSLPARSIPKPPPAAPAGSQALQAEAAAKAAADAEAAKQAALQKATEEKAAAEAAALKAANEKAAAEAMARKAAEEKAAADRAAAEAAAQKAAEEKAAAEAAAAEAAAKQKAAVEAATKESAAAAMTAAGATTAAAATALEREVQPAPAAEEQIAEQTAAAADEQAVEAAEGADDSEAAAAVHAMPKSADIAALVVAVEPPAEGSPAEGAAAGEADEEVESLADLPAPLLSFEGAPASSEGELSEVEQKARQMSLHAHKLVKENNNIVQGSREQKAALDLLLAPEAAGKVRPHLVAACAFALGDMLLAQQKVDETKAALAIAYQASTHIEDKGPQVKALMNFAYILKAQRKRASARAAYEQALALARQQHGPLHGMVEKVKYELTAFLGGSGREAEAANMLISSAAELLGEAERLAAEGGEEPAGKENGGEEPAGKENGGEAPAAAAANGEAAPPSGLEHVEAEAAAEEEEELTPAQTAQHFAMRNLMNAAGVLDGLQQYERAEGLLGRALDIAVAAWGAGSMQQLNVMYALAQHYRRRGMLQESIDFHEGVLGIMDESIQVYSPELLQNRISILRDTAVLLDNVGQTEAAIDYATGAMVNAQTLAGIMQGQQRSTTHPILEPFYRLLAELKQKIGDESGAAEARRQANAARLNQRLAQTGKHQQRAQKGGTSKRSTGSGASTARAGGRRV